MQYSPGGECSPVWGEAHWAAAVPASLQHEGGCAPHGSPGWRSPALGGRARRPERPFDRPSAAGIRYSLVLTHPLPFLPSSYFQDGLTRAFSILAFQLKVDGLVYLNLPK